MQKFFYKAKNEHGETVSGQIETVNQSAVAKVLMSKKLFPIEIRDTEKAKISLEKMPLLSFMEGISKKKKAIAMRQFATLINSGLPITKSLGIMASESTNKKLKEVFTDVLQEVEGGSSLAQAFSRHPEVFSGLDVSLITAGEKSGTLDKVLKRMATQLEKEAQLISKVRGAMIYPAIILTVVIGVLLLMFIYVIPKLAVFYQDFKGKLPAVTQFMLSFSGFLRRFWWAVLLVFIALISGFKAFKDSSKGRRSWDSIKLKIPGLKILITKIYMARFTRTLGTLIGSGVPVLDALKITSESVGNVIYKDEVLKMTSEVRGGSSLSRSISNSALFPSVSGQMVKVGEETGEIDSMLDSLANYYEEEVDNAIKALSTLIEPVIIVFMGFIVAFVLISIMAPIYGISQIIFKK